MNIIWRFLLLSSSVFVFVNGASLFDSSGKLPQVDLALKASSKGSTIIAAAGIDGAVAVICSPSRSESADSLVGKENLNILQSSFKICDTIGFCYGGIISDGTYLRNYLFDIIANHIHIYRSNPSLSRIAASLANRIHENTLSARQRPFGTRCILIGPSIAPTTSSSSSSNSKHLQPPLNEEPTTSSSSSSDPFETNRDRSRSSAIFEVDPVGNCHNCHLSCIGPYTSEIMTSWPIEQRKPRSLKISTLLETSIRLLKKQLESDGIALQPYHLDVILSSDVSPNVDDALVVLSQEKIRMLLEGVI